MKRIIQKFKLDGDEYAETIENFDPSKWLESSPEEVLAFREKINSGILKEQIAKSVTEARYFKLSWEEIGEVLGMSAEAAEQNYSLREAD